MTKVYKLQNFRHPLLMTLVLTLGISLFADADTALRDELIEKYPTIDENTTRPEKKEIICPFLRMLERAGIFDPDAEEQSPLTVEIIKIATAAREFGCSLINCGTVATAVSGGQLTQGVSRFGAVDLEALHKAAGIAHDCGLTFAFEGQAVDDTARYQTLANLEARSDDLGRLTFDDIRRTKLDVCAAQGVDITSAGELEIQLIFSFLGGNERGYVDYSDVELFLNAKLPKTIGTPGLAR